MRTRTIYLFLIVLAGPRFTPAGLACGKTVKQGAVSGSVSVLQPNLTPVYRAKVHFERQEGGAIDVLTGELGKYEAILEREGEYTASVEVKGLCTVHRAPFFWKPGVMLRFDFNMVICPNINLLRCSEKPREMKRDALIQ